MEFLSLLLDILTFPSSSDNGKQTRKQSGARIFIILSIVIGVCWFVFELQVIKDFERPYVFIGLLAIASMVVSILLMFVFFTIGIWIPVSTNDFFLILLCFTLNFASITSFVNRKNGYLLMGFKHGNAWLISQAEPPKSL
jgi:glucan phosphoethanolaminetransferase (alkaline phosphatase superfamily)